MALGKCGGRELGFASDIELMFVYDGGGETTGPQVITAAEFYEKLVVEFTRAIRARREGIFEIDLQLRPYGKAGSLAVSLDAFRRYFAPAGPAWSYERQALVKLRPIAGDEALGRKLRALCDADVYAGSRSTRRRCGRCANASCDTWSRRARSTPSTARAGWWTWSTWCRACRSPTARRTRRCASPTRPRRSPALAAAGIISAENGVRLSDAQLFLHQLINALRMVRGNNKDLTVPAEASEEFAYLARRLGYGDDPNRLGVAISEHMTWVQRLGARLLG